MASLQKITPNLWFDKNAGEAVDFYISVFRNSNKGKTTYYGKAGYDIHQMPEGTLMTVEFSIEGQKFLALNGGPVFRFNEAVSFIVYCESQDEIDYYWEKLSENGDKSAQQCGWLKDKFGLSWQVVPSLVPAILEKETSEKTERFFHAFLQMKKIDMETLQKAYDGK